MISKYRRRRQGVQTRVSVSKCSMCTGVDHVRLPLARDPSFGVRKRRTMPVFRPVKKVISCRNKWNKSTVRAELSKIKHAKSESRKSASVKSESCSPCLSPVNTVETSNCVKCLALLGERFAAESVIFA